MKLKRVYKMISATAPPGMPIERGMVASWIPETSQPGSREYDKIMGCSARTADRPWSSGKQLPLGLNASRQIGSREREISRSNTSGSPRSLILPTKKNNINELQATGGGPALSNKHQAKKLLTPAVGPGNLSLERI